MRVSQIVFIALAMLSTGTAMRGQSDRPKEIRGYKVERAAVEIRGSKKDARKPAPADDVRATADDVDQLISFGLPEVARVTPLGITLNVPVVVAAVKQSGHVHFLTFEDMTVNGHSIEIGAYEHTFDLPNKQPLTLRNPLRFYIYTPTALLAVADEWSNSKETWPVTGRVYVCGKFKKSIFSFKRCVPVELNLTMRNPLKEK